MRRADRLYAPAVPDGLPTPQITLRAVYVRGACLCTARRHAADGDLDALIRDARGDTPLRSLRSVARTARGE